MYISVASDLRGRKDKQSKAVGVAEKQKENV